MWAERLGRTEETENACRVSMVRNCEEDLTHNEVQRGELRY